MSEATTEPVDRTEATPKSPSGPDIAAAATRESARAKLFGAHKRRRVEIGRYVVEKKLGAGAMGEVFLARDPELDRNVALKLVVPGVGASPQANARLLREARALAKLDHPNTVPVHDVGTADDRVWIAMEFIDGCTLRHWCRAKARPIDAIVEVFAAAGRGLGAAHAVGLLHRDFKPDNVMVAPPDADRPASVRVTDFGLAAPVGEHSTLRSAETGDDVALARTLTRGGTLQGTPGYIAPELLEGAPADAATDQFAFCVSLFEALFGVRPFSGRTLTEILLATQSGVIDRRAADRRVPRWVRRVVMRGLSASPTARFPSMDELVRELVRDRSRGRIAIAGGVVIVTASGIAIAMPQDPCPVDTDALQGVWDTERRRAMRDAFESTQLPYAEDAFVHAATGLDAWVEQWSAARVDTCEATHVRGLQSERLLDLRIACLDAKLVEVRALTDAFAASDEQTVRRAAQATAALPVVGRCADAKALESSVGAIEDPEQAAAASLAQQRLAEQRAWSLVGRLDAAAESAVAAKQAADESGHGPTIAEVLAAGGALAVHRGEVEEGVTMLTAAVWEAEASGHDRVAASTTAKLVALVGYQLDRPDRALEWAAHSEALLRRLGGDASIEAERHQGLGLVLDGQGRFAEARAEFEQTLALRREAFGDDAPGVGDALELVAGTYLAAGDVASAQAPYEETLRIRERTVGKHHPDYATALGNLGVAALEAGRIEDARARIQEAIDILVPAVGPDHYDVLILRNNVVRAELEAGRIDAARVLATENAVDSARALGAQHPDTLRAKGTLAQVLEAAGDLAGALRILDEAIAAGGNDAILELMRTHAADLRTKIDAPSPR